MQDLTPQAGQEMAAFSASKMDKRWTEKSLSKLAEQLVQMPPPERDLTKSEALAALVPTLKKMRQRGHSLDSISAALAAQGIEASSRVISRLLASKRQKTSP